MRIRQITSLSLCPSKYFNIVAHIPSPAGGPKPRPRVGRPIKKELEDHILLKMLKDKGFSSYGLASSLNMSRKHLKKAMDDPCCYLTCQHLLIIAGLLGKPLQEVFALCVGVNPVPARTWYEMR